MFFRSAIVAAMAAAFALTSCSNPIGSPTDPTSATTASTGSISLSVKFSQVAAAPGLMKAPASDFTTGVAVLTRGTNTLTYPLTIGGGKAIANISSIAAGTWTLTINFYNATGDLTFTGTTTVVVKNGKIVPVAVTVNPTGGSMSFDLELPIDVAADYLVLWNTLGSENEVLSSLLGPNLAIQGVPTFAPSFHGNGVILPGASAYLSVPRATISAAKGTIEMWFTPNTASTDISRYGYLVDCNVAISSERVQFGWTDTGLLNYCVFDVYGSGPSIASPVFAANQAMHFALVWDKDGIDGSADIKRVYVDGSLFHANSQAMNQNPQASLLMFGHHMAGLGNADGIIDNLKIYSVAKTQFSDRVLE